MTDVIRAHHLPEDSAWQRRQRWLAVAISVLLHGLLALFLFGDWMPSTPPAPVIQTLEARLVTLPPPPPEVAPAPAPEPEPEPAPEPEPKQADLAWERTEPEPESEPEPEPEPKPEPEPEPEPRPESQPEAREQPPRAQEEVAGESTAESSAPAFVPEQVAASDIESSYRPLSKAPPNYPRRALMRDMEADCTVTYTVNKQGRVEALKIEEGECHPLFEQPSLAAARKFRYSPHKIDGKAVTVTGVKNTFHYRLSR